MTTFGEALASASPLLLHLLVNVISAPARAFLGRRVGKNSSRLVRCFLRGFVSVEKACDTKSVSPPRPRDHQPPLEHSVMDRYATSHFSNRDLRVEIKASDGGETKSTAVMLSRIGEYDWRRLFLEDGYPSMHAYCIRELNYTREKASKRIYAARVARKFPVLFDAVAAGALNLSGVVMLARYLRPGNVDELLAAATRRTNEEIAQLIAERFPQPDLPTRLEAITPPLTPGGEPEAGNVQEQSKSLAPGRVESAAPRPRLAPLSAQAFALQMTIRASRRPWVRRAVPRDGARSLRSCSAPRGGANRISDPRPGRFLTPPPCGTSLSAHGAWNR